MDDFDEYGELLVFLNVHETYFWQIVRRASADSISVNSIVHHSHQISADPSDDMHCVVNRLDRQQVWKVNCVCVCVSDCAACAGVHGCVSASEEVEVVGEMWFELLVLVFINVSGVCSNCCPVERPVVGLPGTPPLARCRVKLAGGASNEANLLFLDLLFLCT